LVIIFKKKSKNNRLDCIASSESRGSSSVSTIVEHFVYLEGQPIVVVLHLGGQPTVVKDGLRRTTNCCQGLCCGGQPIVVSLRKSFMLLRMNIKKSYSILQCVALQAI